MILMIKNLKKTIEKYNLIESGDTLVLGLSGGPDSVCLFHLLLELRDELGFDIVACHVNHRLRGEDSEHDEDFVKALCEKNAIRCFVSKQDIKGIAKENNISEEEAGRLARYGFFDETAWQIALGGVDISKIKVATAHNLDDQVETVLMRILRGTSVDGLAGIDFKRMSAKGICIIRPLLEIEKKDVLRCCEENEFEYCVDKTNFESIYTRNRIRNELIPLLQEYNVQIYSAILNLQKNAGIDKNYFKNIVKQYGNVEHKRKELSALDIAVRTRLIKDRLVSVGVSKDVKHEHIMAIDRVLLGDKPNAQVNLPHGNKLIVEYDDVFLLHETGRRIKLFNPCDLKNCPSENCDLENDDLAYSARNNLSSSNKKIDFVQHVYKLVYKIVDLTSDIEDLEDVVFQKNQDEVMVCLDCEKILSIYDYRKNNDLTSMLEIRRRRDGDYMHIKNGKKKIARIFIDEKIPKYYRDSATVVAIGSEVLCIILDNGYKRIDRRFAVDMSALKKQVEGEHKGTFADKYTSLLIIEKKLKI